MGDSLTEGDGNPSAYRYPLFERLFKAGADFRFVGPSSSRDDVRLPALYNHHGGNASTIKSAKSIIRNIRKTMAEYNPRNFKVYDSDGEIDEATNFVPCVYMED